jgi:hypothetical protein
LNDVITVDDRKLTLALEINRLHKRLGVTLLESCIEIGKRLSELKEEVGYGGWNRFCEDHLEPSKRSIERYVKTFEVFQKRQFDVFNTLTKIVQKKSDLWDLLSKSEDQITAILDDHIKTGKPYEAPKRNTPNAYGVSPPKPTGSENGVTEPILPLSPPPISDIGTVKGGISETNTICSPKQPPPFTFDSDPGQDLIGDAEIELNAFANSVKELCKQGVSGQDIKRVEAMTNRMAGLLSNLSRLIEKESMFENFRTSSSIITSTRTRKTRSAEKNETNASKVSKKKLKAHTEYGNEVVEVVECFRDSLPKWHEKVFVSDRLLNEAAKTFHIMITSENRPVGDIKKALKWLVDNPASFEANRVVSGFKFWEYYPAIWKNIKDGVRKIPTGKQQERSLDDKIKRVQTLIDQGMSREQAMKEASK